MKLAFYEELYGLCIVPKHISYLMWKANFFYFKRSGNFEIKFKVND